MLDKADRALQDYYRAFYPDRKCEVCGKKYQVCHHHIEKSKSNAGRFNFDNLIFLCHKCHSRIIFGDHNVVAIYSIRCGREWLATMERLKKIKWQSYTRKELERIIERFTIPFSLR